jgi:UDP-N-acetylglucosamine/UDP-N-acetylgalactosamine diphosphorylase
VAVAPDGNGGIYHALYQQGIIQSLKDRGIRYSHCYSVDNCLAKVADPVFLGYCAMQNSDCGIKVVSKTNPEEPVGVVARRDGILGVVEYSELTPELATRRHDNGQLAFGAANIANHVFSTDFLDRVHHDDLGYHVARKKIACVDIATENQAYVLGVKLERFVFDVFGHAQSFCVLQVDRQDEFSPLKNGPGAAADGPETSRRDILRQAKKFVENAGGNLLNEAIEVEISPLFSYAGENLEYVAGKVIQRSCIINSLDDLKAAVAL